MRFQAGLQIVLIILSIVIVMTIIRPELDKITVVQNEISKSNDAVAKADQYNRHLQQMIDKAESIPRADQVALDRFLPSEIDRIEVARDIENIVSQNGLLLQKVSGENSVEVTVANDPVAGPGSSLAVEAQRSLVAQNFSVSVIGTYENMKNMLRDIERNAYPLRVVSLSFSTDAESLLYTFSLELQTFAMKTNQN